ncbi:glycoside hydrolase family 2 protein [Evansella sp. AB-rgal1]|uniref:glycoside hydrolase family 2 protein n=1 Tax=Evansella sp. AB-rgal1 TaxID=3242696 RepID=UPI00359D9BBD
MTLQLNGNWTFQLDEEDSLKIETITLPLQSEITVPGSWEEQVFGVESQHEPIGTWKKKQEYVGRAWYAREFTVPAEEAKSTFILHLAGVHWFTNVYIDGEFVGSGEGLVMEQTFDISNYIRKGKQQQLVISVDNRLHIPLMESHIHSYHTATNWGGISGGAWIEAIADVTIEKATFNYQYESKVVTVNAEVRDISKDNTDFKVVVAIGNKKETATIQTNQGSGAVSLQLSMGEDVIQWTDSNPYLYDATVTLLHSGEEVATSAHKIGLRQFETKGKDFLLNGEPVFLRGYVDCCIFPETGYPSWDIDHYRKQFRIVKEHGFNHVRLHGWTPPKPFWIAADEAGMLVQTELPHWSFHYTDRNTAAPTEVNAFFYRELERIIIAIQDHPSFVMFALGNELIGPDGHEELNDMVRKAQELDPTRLYTDNTGFGQLPAHDREGDYYIQSLNWHPPYTLDYAGSPNTEHDYRELPKLDDKPLIGHEHGQFTMYGDPTAEEKYTGVLQPSWLTTFQQTLEAKGWSDRVPEFKTATGTHMVRSYKEIMERARRTKGLSGVQLLDIRDFPGQGHATTGILDVFWDSKGVITPEDYRQFNDDRVLLMRSDRRTYFGGEQIEVKLELSNFGGKINEGEVHWQLMSGDNTYVDSGKTRVANLKTGIVSHLATVSLDTLSKGAHSYKLIVTLATEDGSILSNNWDFWSFERPSLPADLDTVWTNIGSLRSFMYGARYGEEIGIEERSYKEEKGVSLAITNQLSRDVLQFAIDGGTVWLMANNGGSYDEVRTKYLPIFWNFLWFPTQESTTMGVIVRDHPALKDFPSDAYSNWQWYHLVDGAPAIGLDGVKGLEPIVEVVDNFNRMKKLTYMFEAKVGKGKVFVSSFRTLDVVDLKRPETSYLFLQLLNYVKSDGFQPTTTLSMGELLRMFKISGHSAT